MRKLSFVVLFGLLTLSVYTQTSKIDSLKNILSRSKNDTNTVNTYNNIAYEFIYSHPDSAYYYGYRGLLMAKDIHFVKGEAGGLVMMGMDL